MKNFTVLCKVKQKYLYFKSFWFQLVSNHMQEPLHSLVEVLILLLKSSNLDEKSEVLLVAN